MRKNDIQVSKNFKLWEFESPDTQEVKLNPLLIEKIQALRDRVGVPLQINSGYRTKEHNTKVGGSPKSQHPHGNAGDIDCPNGMTVDELAEHAEAVGFDGIGKYHTFVHVDVRGYKARWDYRNK